MHRKEFWEWSLKLTGQKFNSSTALPKKPCVQLKYGWLIKRNEGFPGGPVVKICLALQEMGLRYTGIHQTIQPFVSLKIFIPKSRGLCMFQERTLWTSLVAGTVDSGQKSTCQRRGHGFDPWTGKIPHASEQLSPCVHNYWSQHAYSLCSITPQEKSLQWGALTKQLEKTHEKKQRRPGTAKNQ